MRPCLLILGFLVALVAFAPGLRAEEVFVLDNGSVVRGRVVREDGERIVVRLAGMMVDNRITLRHHEITRRYVSVDPNPGRSDAPRDAEPPIHVPLGDTRDGPRTVLLAPDGTTRLAAPRGTGGLPRSEPALARESFSGRLTRVTAMALPASLEGRLLVGFLLLVVLTVLVAGGTKLLAMKAPSLHASTTLGLVLGLFLMADILLHGELLRADRALWVLPLEAAIWLACARALLDAPLAKGVPLLAMVLFASTCFVFATGSLLVSV